MSYGCGCQDCCSQCCRVNLLFWVYVLGIAGTFASLFFFFWQYAGTLTQFRGPKDEGYFFASSGSDTELSIYRNGVVIASGIDFADNGITTDSIIDLRQARCRGTSLLWTMLLGGLFSVLLLLWWFVECPNRFICCSLQQPYEALQRQQGIPGMPPMPMPMMKTAPMPTTMAPPPMPGAPVAPSALASGPKLA